MTGALEYLQRPVDRSTAREFHWRELLLHCALQPHERAGLLAHLDHVLIVWLWCNAQWDVLPSDGEWTSEDLG